jgi:hypothetical protein
MIQDDGFIAWRYVKKGIYPYKGGEDYFIKWKINYD